jgi:hypothetical protein
MSGFETGNASIVEKRKKVGVLTFHYTTNYGGVLQAYALTKFIRDIGFNCDVIDYRPASALRAYGKQLLFRKNFLIGFKKALCFHSFINKNLKLSQKSTYHARGLPGLCEPYDVVVVGSDEVWKINSFRGYDPSFFLSFLSSEKTRVSFSASLGSTSTLSKKRQEICQEIGKFSAISVRDDHSIQVLNDECSIQAEKFLDPTLLIDDWDEVYCVSKNLSHSEPFILIYGKLNADELSIVQGIAKRNDCLTVAVGEYNAGVDINRIAVGPGEWLSYFKSAKLIFTSFFHGVIFALKFHEEVFVFRREDKSYKIDQLKVDLDLVMERDIDLANYRDNVDLRHYKFSELTETLIDRGKARASQFLIDAIGAESAQ